MAKWEPDVSNKAFHRGGYPLYVVKCFWPKSKTFLLTMEHVLLVAKWQNICCKKQNYSVLSLSLDHTNIDSILAWPLSRFTVQHNDRAQYRQFQSPFCALPVQKPINGLLPYRTDFERISTFSLLFFQKLSWANFKQKILLRILRKFPSIVGKNTKTFTQLLHQSAHFLTVFEHCVRPKASTNLTV